MFNSKRSILFVIMGGAVVLLALGCGEKGEEPAPGGVEEPVAGIAVKATCVVPPAEFAKWFQTGSVTKNGVVTAANSLEPLETACDFYRWSWRMFLWQLSRNERGYVFNRPPFYDLNDNNQLVSNQPGASSLKFLRGGKREGVEREGQAGLVSGVLMSQKVGVASDGSLVYYAIHVNDLYAYMASGVNSGELKGITTFPTTADERDAIVAYAKAAYGVEIADANSLTMELKSSWVKADDAMVAGSFVTIQADIPKFERTSDKLWTWDGTSLERDVTLACVGYHLVGSADGHPEMIWATFEHEDNVPDDDFYYIAQDGTTTQKKNWSANGTPIQEHWRFMDGTSKKQSMNQMHMQMKGQGIVANPDSTISPSNTMRTHPWGNAPDEASAANNTDIISLNQNIRSMLADGDVRKNYFLVGATWTANGVPGVGEQLPVVAGSLTLANATMETYFQYKNCFDCHQGGAINGLSHIFGGIKPLPKPGK